MLTRFPVPDIPPEDPVLFLARRIRREYALSARATYSELLAVCEARGVDVVESASLIEAGCYVQLPDTRLPDVRPVIIVRQGMGAFVLAHELYHHLIADNSEWGVVYLFPRWVECPIEAAAHRFAALLCGEEWEA